jgi:hypothetical protein
MVESPDKVAEVGFTTMEDKVDDCVDVVICFDEQPIKTTVKKTVNTIAKQ